MKALFRIVCGILLGFIQALTLSVLLGWVCKSGEAGALLFLLSWPVLAWRSLRQPAAAAREPAPLLRRSVLPLVALPIVAAFPLLAFVASLKGEGGAVLGLLTLALLFGIAVCCWGAAFMAFLAHLGTRKKP